MDAPVDFLRLPFDELVTELTRLGVPTDQPGFYDHPALVELEQQGVDTFTNVYGRFVAEREYTAEYLEWARPKIKAGAIRLYELLATDGQLGACINCSLSFSRMLDELGIWNYPVFGATTVTVPVAHGRSGSFHFYAVQADDGSSGEVGHKWVFAPPYSVIDLTIKLQNYGNVASQSLPNYVMVENASVATVDVRDILSPAILANLKANGIPRALALGAIDADLPTRLATFPAYAINRGGVDFKYVTCAVGVSDAPLKEITSFSLMGRSAFALFQEEIRPAMEAASKK